MNKKIAAAVASSLALVTVPFVSSNANAITSPTTTANGVVIDNNATHWARGDVKVLGTTKPGTYTLVSYKINADNQTRYDSSSKFVAASGPVSFHVHLPDCATQIDLVRGTNVPSPLPASNFFHASGTFIASFVSKDSLCGGVVPTPTPTPTVSETPSETPTVTPTPSETPVPSETPTASETPVPSETPTATVTPSETPVASVTPTVLPTPSETATVVPTVTPSVTPSITPSTTTTPVVVVTESPGADDSTPTASPTTPVRTIVKPSATPAHHTVVKVTQRPAVTESNQTPVASTQTLAHTGASDIRNMLFIALGLLLIGAAARTVPFALNKIKR